MAIRRWDPFRELQNLDSNLPRLTGRGYGDNGGEARANWAPPLDIYETPEAYRVVAELPGFGPDDVDVTVNENLLTIKGERKFYDEVSEQSFHRIERRFGQFQRLVSLPSEVDADKVEATFDKGVLTVGIPKAEKAKPKRVEIKAQS